MVARLHKDLDASHTFTAQAMPAVPSADMQDLSCRSRPLDLDQGLDKAPDAGGRSSSNSRFHVQFSCPDTNHAIHDGHEIAHVRRIVPIESRCEAGTARTVAAVPCSSVLLHATGVALLFIVCKGSNAARPSDACEPAALVGRSQAFP